MSDHSLIQWTDATLNAIVGCDYVSAGCLHCYAATLHNRRYLAWKRGRFPTAPAQYHQPFKRVQLMPERLLTPFRWREPKRVFFNSMSDLWHEDVPDWFIARTWAMMALTPQHIWQVLTKRPERMCTWLRDDHYDDVLREANYLRNSLPAKRLGDIPISNPARFPLPNVWLGVSVEDQAAADARIPLLLQTPAAVRFLSCEPLLGPVNLAPWLRLGWICELCYRRDHAQRLPADWGLVWQSAICPDCQARAHAEDIALALARGGMYTTSPDPRPFRTGLSWVIIGGESGQHARGMHPEWACSLVEQCRAAGVAPFMKQLGSALAYTFSLKDRHGGDMSEWPPDYPELRVREFPQTAGVEVAP